LVPRHSSSKNVKAALLLAEDVFSIVYRFRAYPPLVGYGVPSHYIVEFMEMNMQNAENRIN